MNNQVANAIAKTFNHQNPVGTNVYAVNYQGDVIWTATTSEAYVVGEGDPSADTAVPVVTLAMAEGVPYPLGWIVVHQNTPIRSDIELPEVEEEPHSRDIVCGRMRARLVFLNNGQDRHYSDAYMSNYAYPLTASQLQRMAAIAEEGKEGQTK